MTKVATKLAGTTRFDRIAYGTVRSLVTGFCRTWCRMSVEGREHVPTSGAFLLAPVHRSIIDTPVSSGITSRRLRYMGADKYWKNKAFGRLLSALGGFPVTRHSADREALKRCIDVLRGGEPLVLFPEGERKEGPVVQPLFDGAAYIAVKAGVPIIPLGIGGTQRAMPKGSKFIFPRKVHVIVGAPIYPPADASGRAIREATKEISATLHGELQRLYDAAQQRC
jgi:1-acyl-sn-glycerol-3-phosphate acyltransferase